MLDQLDEDVNLEQIDASSLNYWKMRCKTQLDNLLLVYYKKFNELLPEPQLVFDLDSRTIAGQAVYPNKIRINLKFLLQEREHYIDNVVGHELAHYIVFHFIERKLIKSRAVKPHGAEWRALMYLFGIEPNVYHTYDVEPREGTLRYLCNCKVHWLTKIRHNRCLKGTQYYCKKCGSLIKYQPDESVQPGAHTHKIYKQVRGASSVVPSTTTHPISTTPTPISKQFETTDDLSGMFDLREVEHSLTPVHQSQISHLLSTLTPRSAHASQASQTPQATQATWNSQTAQSSESTQPSSLFQPVPTHAVPAGMQDGISGEPQSRDAPAPQVVVTAQGLTLPLAKGVKPLRPQGILISGASRITSTPQSGTATQNGVTSDGSGAVASMIDEGNAPAPNVTGTIASAPKQISAYRRQQQRQALEALDSNDTFLGYLQDTGVSSLYLRAQQQVNERVSTTRKRKK